RQVTVNWPFRIFNLRVSQRYESENLQVICKSSSGVYARKCDTQPSHATVKGIIGNRYVNIHHAGRFGRIVGVSRRTPKNVAMKLKLTPFNVRLGISKIPMGSRAS